MMLMDEAIRFHVPVMTREVLEGLAPAPGKTVVDGTVGTGGHAQLIARLVSPGGRVVGIDRDEDALNLARQRLEGEGAACELVHGNFQDIDTILSEKGILHVDGILLDLGVSSLQLDTPERGFSFQSEGPLDMRLDKTSYISAYDLINNLNEDELSCLLRDFGQERWHHRIARFLVEERQKHPIATTSELAEIVKRATPYKYRFSRIHPATRTFQAVRIAVNRELETLERALSKAVDLLAPGGRICVISFHSLEDRIVKHRFKEYSAEGRIRIITPKPLTPSEEEVAQNPRSRSSKLRVAERLTE
jgi:16S rRNA (cytosine1402-N4)-methyltransferase